MHKQLGRLAFRVIDRASGTGITDKLRFLDGSQWWSPDRLRGYQLDRLRQVIEHAFDRVPFYRKRLASAEAAIRGGMDLEALRCIPSLTKDEIVQAGGQILDPNPSYRVQWDVTSGSTGTPLRFCKSQDAAGWHRAHNLRCLSWYGVRPGDIQARVWGIPIRVRDRRRERLKDLVLNRERFASFDLDDDAISRKLSRMRRLKPQYVFGYPSAIHAMARFLLRERQALLGSYRPLVVMTTAEMLYPDQQADIEAAFECPVANEYGASEMTIMASSCPSGSLHLNDEAVLTEFEPTDLTIDGVRAHSLIFTDLKNRAMPLIRYRLGDLGIPESEPCRCGRGLSRVRLLGGREVDVLRTASGHRVHGSVFSYLGKSILIAGGVRRFRATQTALDRVDVQIEPGEDFDPKCLDAMRREFTTLTGGDVDLVFVTVDRLEPEVSGKLRYFVGLGNSFGRGSSRTESS